MVSFERIEMKSLSNALSNRTALGLMAILLLALVVRLPGQIYPLPLSYDEASTIRNTLRCLPPCGTLAHPFLSRYLVYAAEGTYFVAGLLAGSFASVADFKSTWLIAPQGHLIAGRMVALVAALATVWATWRLGRVVADDRAGLGAAALVAVSPLHAMVSNNAHVWAPGACLSTLGLVAMLRIEPSSSRRDLLLVGGLIGAATATVYPLGLLLLPLLVVLGDRWRARAVAGEPAGWPGDVLTVGATVSIVVLLVNFPALLRWRRFMDSLFYSVSDMAAQGAVPVGYLTNAAWYLSSLWDPYRLGPVLTIVAVLGLLRFAWSGEARLWALIVFLAGIFLIQPIAFPLWSARYTVAAYPVLAVAASAFVVAVADRLRARSMRLARVPLALLLLVLVALPSALAGADYARVLLRTPTRELARQWIEREIPSGSSLVMNTDRFYPLVGECDARRVGPRRAPAEGPCYHIMLAEDPATRDETLRSLVAQGADYYVGMDAWPPRTKARLGIAVGPPRDAAGQAYPLVAEFAYDDLDRFVDDAAMVNPGILVYRLPR